MAASLQIETLDPTFFNDRLHFSFLEFTNDPEGRPVPPRESKTTGVVRLTNDGDAPLNILDAELSGPFSFLAPSGLDGVTLAAGQSIDVTIVFDRDKYVAPTGTRDEIDAISTVFSGQLSITTNAPTPIGTVNLAGFWQQRPETGLEPNLNEIFEVFGFGNRIEGLSLRGAGQLSALSDSDVYRPGDETEVLSPYWRIADGLSEARLTMIAAYRGPTNAGRGGIHAPGDLGNVDTANRINFWRTAETDSQQFLPNSLNNVDFGTRVFSRADIPDAWNGDDVFGVRIEGLSSDPRLNPTGDVLIDVNGVKYDRLNSTTAVDPNGVQVPIANLQLIQQGYFVRVFQVVDAAGNLIPNAYIVAQDYVGLNYDYQDNVMLLEGVTPVGAFSGFLPVIGTSGANTLTGSDAADSMAGLQGNDVISGLDGADVMYGGPGSDSMIGGAGDDTLIGGTGNDSIEGGPGSDSVDAGDGNDTLVGGAGDTVLAGTGNDLILAEDASAKLLDGGSGFDVIDTTAVSSGVSITLGTGATSVAGQSFLNFENIVTGAGADTLAGNGFGNRIESGAGADSVLGNAGNDTIFGGSGNDTINSGDAADQIFGGDGDDNLNGSTGNDLVNGEDDNDSIFGGDGFDTLNGGDGNDTILGDRAADLLNGGAGSDSLNGGTGDDTLNGEAGNDTLLGGDGADRLNGGDDADNLIGGNNGDTLNGGDGGDLLNAGAGSDSLDAGDGNDTLLGGDGNDTLIGGAGRDILNGGTGNDQFVFQSISESPNGLFDTISSFDSPGNPVGDRIVLASIDANLDLAGDQAFVFGFAGLGGLIVIDSGTDTLIRGDISADAGFELEIRIADGDTVLASAYTAVDFIL